MSDIVKHEFSFGIATSSYHYEGGNYNSNWKIFEDKIFDTKPDQKCGIGIDYWNRWREDHEYLSELGVTSFRTSVEWSRIEPTPGNFDEQVLEQYREMFQDLQNRGIEVTLTLFHYSMPIWFSHLGGFRDKRNLKYFENFTHHTLEKLHPYISAVTPMNEILVYSLLGYMTGYWPPNNKSAIGTWHTTRNLIRAHFITAEIIHNKKYAIKIGTAEHSRIFNITERKWIFETFSRFINYFFNKAVTKSIIRNRFAFPLGLRKVTKRKHRSLDFIGVQFYPSVRAGVIYQKFIPKLVPYDSEGTWAEAFLTSRLRPKDLFLTLREYSKLGKPIIITESGVQTEKDSIRIDKLTANLDIIQRARKKGIDVRGYYYFTLFDCFEWAEGYTKKFGLISIDRSKNLTRKKKKSFQAYKNIISAFQK